VRWWAITRNSRGVHTYHTDQIGGLQLMLNVTAAPGNESHANTTWPGLIELIEGLPQGKRPALVRGDSGQGAEPTVGALEARGVHYLFKLRLTKNAKRYIERQFATPEWAEAGQGCQGRDGTLQLTGWRHARRFVVLRRALRGELLLADKHQLSLAFIEKDVRAKGYEYAVLVTDLDYSIRALAQLHRDRAGASQGSCRLNHAANG
jgi:hypothetical protein